MAEVKWIKIVTDIFDDEKILLIESMPEADSIIVMWFKLLCLAGRQNNSGVFMMNGRIPYTDEMFATIFRRPLNTVRLALKVFEQYGMIEIINSAVTIPNWGKHQSIDQMQARREYQRQYHIEYRKKQKLLAEGGEVDDDKDLRKRLRKQDVNALDKIREEEDKIREEESTVPRKRFTPPTVDEVSAYCQERKNNVDPQRFVDYYTAQGWHIGKNPMKDWKAAVRTWERNDKKPVSKPTPSKGTAAQDYQQRHYDGDMINLFEDDEGVI